MKDWHPTTVAEVLPAAEELMELILDLRGSGLVGTHLRPGQYVHLSLPGLGEAPFAIASAPQAGGTRWEFLLKGGSALSDALIRLAPGALGLYVADADHFRVGTLHQDWQVRVGNTAAADHAGADAAGWRFGV